MPRSDRRIRRLRSGRFQVRLSPEERAVLRTLPEQLRELLDSDDPALVRLFPPAYGDDAERSAEYAALVGDDLRAHRRSALDVMEATIDADGLDEEQMAAWLEALNDFRLVLGTRLEVTEEMRPDDISEDDPQAPGLALYYYLGWLQEQIVEALASGVDPAGTIE